MYDATGAVLSEADQSRGFTPAFGSEIGICEIPFASTCLENEMQCDPFAPGRTLQRCLKVHTNMKLAPYYCSSPISCVYINATKPLSLNVQDIVSTVLLVDDCRHADSSL